MGDGIKTADTNASQRPHGHRSAGKIHKGHNIVAASSSIPSKYQTIVTDNSDRKGFLSKSRRFNYDQDTTDHPGPGFYVKHDEFSGQGPSYSKKGTGGFASKAKRSVKQSSHVNVTPGPAAYGLPNLLKSRRDFGRSTASNFCTPIAVNKKDVSDTGIPAPNQYEVALLRTGKKNNVVAGAAFKSQSKREVINVGEARAKPSPWQYNVKDDFMKASIKVPISSFKSQSRRRMAPDPPPYPGPGEYKPNEPVEPVSKLLFPKKHYLCISAPAMPLPATPPMPGPGQYELRDFEGPQKHYMSSSVFVSSTTRWTGNVDAKNSDNPGPAHYRPLETAKQSFIYNSQGKWLPA